MNAQQVRAYLTQTALNKALDESRRAERRRTTALDEFVENRADTGEQVEERVAANLAGAPVREIIAELPARQQAVVKLRFYFERAPEEIQQVLGMTERTYRRQLERAMRKITERYELVRTGLWCEDHRKLVIDYVAGLAEDQRAERARAHLRGCPGCARMAAELRVATRRTAALLPMPALVEQGHLTGRLGDLVDSARDLIGEGARCVERLLAPVYSRVDPASTSFAGAVRPGTIAASISACLAIGGGATYCAVEGLPEPLRSLAGVSSEAADKERPEPPQEPQEPAEVVPDPVIETAPIAPQPAPTTQTQQQSDGQDRTDDEQDGSSDDSDSSAPTESSTPEFSPEAPAPTTPAPSSGGGGSSSPPASSGGEFDL